jgi:hypothetical protein
MVDDTPCRMPLASAQELAVKGDGLAAHSLVGKLLGLHVLVCILLGLVRNHQECGIKFDLQGTERKGVVFCS